MRAPNAALLGALGVASASAFLPVFMMHGIGSDAGEMAKIAMLAAAAHPGTVLTSLPLYESLPDGLTDLNPACVLPCLRTTLIQLLAEMDAVDDGRTEGGSARLLGVLIRSAPRLAKPYVAPGLEALIRRLEHAAGCSSAVAASGLGAIGELSVVGSALVKEKAEKPMLTSASTEKPAPAELCSKEMLFASVMPSCGMESDVAAVR